MSITPTTTPSPTDTRAPIAVPPAASAVSTAAVITAALVDSVTAIVLAVAVVNAAVIDAAVTVAGSAAVAPKWLPQRGQRGQSTVEYALILLGAAAIALMVVAWVTRSDAIGQLFDSVLGRVLQQAG